MSEPLRRHEAADLSVKLIEAIEDPEKWGDVLDWIIETTPVKGAIITLRDKVNAQIVNDHALEQKFHSPLIRGFDQEAIVYYLTELRTIDPWAAFQKNHYPHLPMQMSKVCPPETVKEQRFLTWLRGVGFEDTIVFELERMSGYWTAINLFLERGEGSEAEAAMAFAKANYNLLRQSWQTSQSMARIRQSNAALLDQAARGGAPVCLVGPNAEMIECNPLFDELIEQDAIRVSGEARKLSFARTVNIHGLDRWEQHAFTFHSAETEPYLLLATPVNPDPLFADKREQMWLLTCTNFRDAKVVPEIARAFNLDALTRREKQLYQEIANGLFVEAAGRNIGLGRTKTFEVWAEIKDKLGITSAHQLR
ncbi:MAG: hypothetical protein AAGL89_15580 [Pseudomonadota bacterium]